MYIFPAIDLKGGACVRLTKGDFGTAVVYEPDPVQQAKAFAEAGSEWLHIVDLDGAKTGAMQQIDIIKNIVKTARMKVQVGGGIRSVDVIQDLLDCGVARVTIGSMAVTDYGLVKSWLKKFGADSILLAFDVNLVEGGRPLVATHGWQKGEGPLLWEILEAYMDDGLKTVMCTDIARDGLLLGSNQILYRQMRDKCPKLDLLASGGVKDIDDLAALAKIGVHGAIVGKAIYEGRINLKEAIIRVQHAR